MSKSAGRNGSRFWDSFGPGLLWAAAAIGVSHLVQSTRAGATTGFALAGVIFLALVLKFPFFEFGPRYAAATRQSLVEGYARIGDWALWLYLLITLATALISEAAIVLFTAFLLRFAFGLEWSLPLTGAIITAACAALLWLGRFRALEGTVKLILVVLGLSTVVAAVVTIPHADFSTFAAWPGSLIGSVVPFAFLLALVGWMPSPIDTSIWSSLWTLAKDETEKRESSVQAARMDFLIGYVGTGMLAFAFVTLGAGVMFGSGETLSSQGPVFATQLVDLYSRTLGEWTRPMVLAAVLTTMASTALTVIDGFPRAIERTILNLRSRKPIQGTVPSCGNLYWTSLAALAVLTVVILLLFIGNLTSMVDFATIVSFLTAPALGYLNLRAVTSADVPPEHRPGRAMLLWSWIGLILLGGTGVVYLISLV